MAESRQVHFLRDRKSRRITSPLFFSAKQLRNHIKNHQNTASVKDARIETGKWLELKGL
jgi:hypothetical protein